MPPGVCRQRMVAFVHESRFKPPMPSSNLMLRYFISLHQWLSWTVESAELCNAMIDTVRSVDSDIDLLSMKSQHWLGRPR